MKRAISVVILFLAAASMTACVSVTTTRLDDSYRRPAHRASVRVYLAEKDMPPNCEKVALLSANGDSKWTDESDMVEKAKEKAAGVGANAVLLNQIDEPSAGAKIAGAFLGVSSQRHGQLVAMYCPKATENPARLAVAARPARYKAAIEDEPPPADEVVASKKAPLPVLDAKQMKDARCLQSDFCSQYGRCASDGVRCVATDDVGCKKSLACQSSGKCKARDGQCVK